MAECECRYDAIKITMKMHDASTSVTRFSPHMFCSLAGAHIQSGTPIAVDDGDVGAGGATDGGNGKDRAAHSSHHTQGRGDEGMSAPVPAKAVAVIRATTVNYR